MLMALWNCINTELLVNLRAKFAVPLLCLGAVSHQLYNIYFDLILTRYYLLAHVHQKPYRICGVSQDSFQQKIKVFIFDQEEESIYLPPFFRMEAKSLEDSACFVLHAHSDGMMPGSVRILSPYGQTNWSLSYGGFLRMQTIPAQRESP